MNFSEGDKEANFDLASKGYLGIFNNFSASKNGDPSGASNEDLNEQK